MVTRLEFYRGQSNGHYDAPKEAEKAAQIIFARTAVDTIKVTLSAGPSYWFLLDRNVGDLLPLGQELAEKLDHGLKVWISNGE
jgi:hypothetical protein